MQDVQWRTGCGRKGGLGVELGLLSLFGTQAMNS